MHSDQNHSDPETPALFRIALTACTLVALLLVGPLAGAEEGPLSIDDMRALRKERKRPYQIMKLAEERGISFLILDKETERELRKIGFSRTHLRKLREISGRTSGSDTTSDGPKQRRDAALKKEEKEAAPQLPPDPDRDARMDRMDQRIQKIIKSSATGVKLDEGHHTRLISKGKLGPKYLKVVRRWEQMAAKRFPNPLGGHVDRRGINIALFNSRYDYQRWVKAMFEVFEEEGTKFNSPNAAERASKTKSFFVRGIFSAHVADDSHDQISHLVAFASAFMAIQQVSQDTIPDALATGYGNLAETMMFKDQYITVQSGYTQRKIDREAMTWDELMKKQFKLNQIASVQNVLVYTTNSMQLPQYAQGWSLMSLLAGDEKKLAEFITRLSEDEDPYEALSAIYEMDDEAMMKRWKNFARARARR